jgi:hypothetical protein
LGGCPGNVAGNVAFTQGNVISNVGLGQGAAGINTAFLADHETLHVWQQRFFGPLFQVTDVVCAVGGFIVGTVIWFFNTNERWAAWWRPPLTMLTLLSIGSIHMTTTGRPPGRTPYSDIDVDSDRARMPPFFTLLLVTNK